jgi:Werner syndrome ATP-dependent helicase
MINHVFFRPNLFLSVNNKSSDVSKDLKAHMTRNGSKFEFEGSTIIYCPTKKATMETAAIVKGLIFKSVSYMLIFICHDHIVVELHLPIIAAT